MKRLAHPRDDDGNALILVLVFIVVFGIVMAAILNFSSTGIATAQRIAEVRDEQNAVDSAVQGAIESLRQATLGAVGNSCTSSDFSPPAATGDPKVVVTCTRQALSGNPAPPVDIPNWAILTVGSAAGEGFHATITGNDNNLQVNGGIFSYGDITVSNNNRLSVVGRAIGKAVNAGATCDADRILATVPVVCATTDPAANSADEASYDYDHQIIAIPTTDPPTSTPVDPYPTCPGGSAGVVNFHPGVYTVLPTYLAQKASCTGDVWWFKPGTYYLHFPDTNGLLDVTTPAAVSIIAGTPDCTGTPTCTAPVAGGTDGSGLADWSVSASSIDARLGAGLQTCQKGGNGVQFILGGKSQLKAGGNTTFLQMCAKNFGTPPTKGGQQQIAIYALKADESPSTAQTGITKVGTNWGSPVGTVVLTGSPQTATVSVSKSGSPNPKEGSFTVGAFGDIPEGSIVTRMRLQVDHVESNTGLNERVDITFPSGATYSCTVPDASTPSTVTCPDIPVTTGGKPGLSGAGLPVWRDVNDLATGASTVKYTVNGSPNSTQTDTVTGIRLLVDYRPQWFERSTLGASDPVLDTFSPNATSRIYGTVWAPTGALLLKLHGGGLSIYHRGVIARTIDATVISSSTQNDAPFQLPSSNAAREVVLVAHLNSASGPVRLRARVRYVDVNTKGDSDPSNDVGIPGYKVQVLNWQVVRP